MYSKRKKEKEYAVEKILSKRLTGKGKIEYYLKWRDFPKTENSWEPVENLNCPGLVKAYEDSFKSKCSGKKRKLNSFNLATSTPVPKRKKAKNTDDTAINITALPKDVLLKIFAYLTQEDLGRLAKLCRRFNECTKSPDLWKKVAVRFHRCSRESVNEITANFFEKLPNCVTHLFLNFDCPFRWNDRLDLEEFCMNIQKRCPRIQSLKLHSTKISVGLRTAIDICAHFLPNLDELSFCDSLFGDCPIEMEYRSISKITVLNLIGCHCRIRDFKKHFFSKFPHLKKLYLGYINAGDFLLSDTSLLSRLEVLYMYQAKSGHMLFKTLLKRSLNMTELYLCFANINDSDLSFNKSTFQQLKIICLRYTNVTVQGIIILIKSCPILQSVFVTETVAEMYAAHPFVSRNSFKLNIIKSTEDSFLMYCYHKFRLIE